MIARGYGVFGAIKNRAKWLGICRLGLLPVAVEKWHKLVNLLLHLRGNSEGGSMSWAIFFPVVAAILVTVLILIVLYWLVSHFT